MSTSREQFDLGHHLEQPDVPAGPYLPAKRAFDVLMALLGSLILLPLYLMIILGIKLSSPGPVFYRGVRTGIYGIPFKIYKFRTMVVDAERKGGGTTALNDPRVFPLGRFLRKYKLDELPQLLNVLVGDMSLVGPRPELPVYTARYTQEEAMILSVRPGITDPSSVRFSSLDEVVGSVDADEIFEAEVLPRKNRLRLDYVKNRSFWGDVAIIFRTLSCIVAKR